MFPFVLIFKTCHLHLILWYICANSTNMLGTTLLSIGTSSSSIIQIKAIQNQVVDVAANLDFSDITHFCCSLFGQKIENMNGATFYAFSVSVTNTPALKAMQYPKLVKWFIRTGEEKIHILRSILPFTAPCPRPRLILQNILSSKSSRIWSHCVVMMSFLNKRDQ